MASSFQIGAGRGRRVDVRLAHDFDQGHPGAVEVHAADGRGRVVHELAGVFFHVDPADADALSATVGLHIDVAVLGEGQFVLGNLVALGQVGVEIVLAGETASRAMPQPVASAMRRV